MSEQVQSIVFHKCPKGTSETRSIEVDYMFRTKVLRWFEEKVKAKDLSKLYTSIINKEPKIFEEELGRLLVETIICYEKKEHISCGNAGYTAKLVPCQAVYAYHGFVVGALANMHDYIIKSNREGGSGRSDLFIKSVSKRGVAIVIEFKIAKKIDDLEKRADDALKQIQDKCYDKGTLILGVPLICVKINNSNVINISVDYIQ